MKSDDLCVALGLSSYKSDLQWNLSGISNQFKEWNCFETFAEETASAF